SPSNSGTANTVVTLSTGQYGSQQYEIEVVLTGSYTNILQTVGDKTATIVVSKPAATSQITGGGTILSTGHAPAGIYASTTNPTSYSVGLQYNKSGTNPQGKVSLSIEQSDGSFVYFQSNSITSITATHITGGKRATVYTKATVYRIDNLGNLTTIDGNVTLRTDVDDTTNDVIGFTALSTKDSSLYYSNDWVYDSTALAW